MLCEDLCGTEFNIIQLLGTCLATPNWFRSPLDLQVTETLYTTWRCSDLVLSYTLISHDLRQKQMSRSMRFPTMWCVQPAKAQTSLRIRAD